MSQVEGWGKHDCRIQEGVVILQLFVRLDYVC